MTYKRDLKRRIRERQARTGEAYTTAREHVLAAKPSIDVIDVLDMTADAAAIGLTCPVSIWPKLAERAEPRLVLARLRDALLATVGDPKLAVWHGVALRGERPVGASWTPDIVGARRFVDRALAGIGGISDDRRMIALHVQGREGVVAVLAVLVLYPAALVARAPQIMLNLAEASVGNIWVWR